MSFWTTPLSTTISNWFGGSSSSSSNKSTSSTTTKTTSTSTTTSPRSNSAVNSKYTSPSTSTGASNTGSSAQSKNKNSSTGTGTTARSNSAVNSTYTGSTTSTAKTTGTGSNIGSTGGSTTASNIEAAKPVQSNISGGGTTYTLTYSSDMGGKGTSQTWQSSDGSGAIAFAGISASDLALYYAQQGNYEASAKLNSLAAAEAAGMTSFTTSATSSSTSGNWRNSAAGEAISLGEATLEDYAAANERGANYVVDNLGNVVYEKKDGTLDYPSVPTTGSTLTAGMQATQSTYAVTTPEAIISASQPSIPTDPGTANLPTDTGGTNLPTTQDEIVVNIEIPETSATGGGDSGIMEMLAALFMMNQANSGGDIGWQAGPAPEPETKEETEETQEWKKYILPIGGALLFVGVVALVVSNNNGGAKA